MSMKNINENELKKYILKKLQESYFDEFEFDKEAMKAAMSDIESDSTSSEFEELGSSKFEKDPEFKNKFKQSLKQANLELPSDEEEVERYAQLLKQRKAQEDRFGKGSLNEIKMEYIEDSKGNPIKLKSQVKDIESGVIGYVDRFMQDDNTLDILVKVNWINTDNLKIDNPIDPKKLIVKENTMMNEEAYEASRYMFFSNLEQIRRQAGLLLDMKEDQLNSILEDGHDWAQDHIATAKESIDQVFDFLMNETKSGDMWKSTDLEDRESEDEFEEEIEEGMGRSYTIGMNKNAKPVDYPEELVREVAKKILKKKLSHLISENENEKFYVVDNDFNKKNYPDLVGKIFDNPPSYAQVKVVGGEEKEEEIEESSSNSLMNKHGKNIKPKVSYLKEGLKDDRYEEVIYLQDNEANHVLNILKQDGKDEAMDYLMQWHQPGNHESSNELGIGTSDRVYKRGGYIMYWNHSLGYIGLVFDEKPEIE